MLPEEVEQLFVSRRDCAVKRNIHYFFAVIPYSQGMLVLRLLPFDLLTIQPGFNKRFGY